MSLEIDLRNFLVTANTPAGNYVYMTTAPQDVPATQPFITVNLESSDGQHTTSLLPGKLTFSTVNVICNVKGTDQFAQYVAADALSVAVRTSINAIQTWPYQMGNTLIYYMAIESKPEQAKSRGWYAMPYQYHEGKASGIQSIVVPLAVNHWDPQA
jgi:hypothetical protein